MPERKPYVIEETTATLVLDETTPFPGAEIDVSLSVAWPTLMAIRQWLTDMEELGEEPDSLTLDAALTGAAELFEPYLSGWNLVTKAGRAVPSTAKGLLSFRDPRLMPAIISAWVSAIGASEPTTD